MSRTRKSDDRQQQLLDRAFEVARLQRPKLTAERHRSLAKNFIEAFAQPAASTSYNSQSESLVAKIKRERPEVPEEAIRAEMAAFW